MKRTLRGLTSLLLVACLSSLSGCGGGGEEMPDGQALPTSYEMVASARSLDVAVDGEGWFVLQTKDGRQRSFSRFGRLDLDHEGQLIHADGSLVLGRISESDVDVAPIPKASFTMPARVTTQVSLEGNLDARVSVASVPFDPSDPASYSFANTVAIYTPISRVLTLYFRKVSEGNSDDWVVHASLDGRMIGANLVLHFTAMGLLDAATTATLTVPLVDGVVPYRLRISLGGMSQFGTTYSITDVQQDGYGPGVLDGGEVDLKGRLKLSYSNGQRMYGGLLVLARFTVADRLRRIGDSSWVCDAECAPPIMGFPGSALLGQLRSNELNSVY